MSAGVVAIIRLALRQLLGTPLRSLLGVVAVAAGVSLIAAVLSLGAALDRAVNADDSDRHLVVMQAHRYCPLTSWLPQHRASAIAAVDGVANVRPLRILPSHCGTALDVVVLRGVPPEDPGPELQALSGSIEAWRGRDDGALVGQATARRRGLSVGDQLEVAGVQTTVMAITDGPRPVDREHVRVHLEMLQRSVPGRGAGLVTAFQVVVASGHDGEAVASAIDRELQALGEMSSTRSESEAMVAAARDLITLANATQVLALAAALAVAMLVANALILGLRARRRSIAILAAVGYPGRDRALLVLCEGILLAMVGGLIGVGLTFTWLSIAPPGIASEGWSLDLRPDSSLIQALLASALLGLVAAVVPAWRAARLDLPSLLRAGAAA